MNKGKVLLSRLIVWTVFCLLASPVGAQQLIFTYWLEALEPFAIRSEHKLTGGMVKDIGDELAARMKLEAKYIELPTKRVAIMVTEGDAHVSCLTNPKWEENPKNYHWSPVLFQGSDNFLVKQDRVGSIKTISDLKGKRVGTYNGYVYREEIMVLFDKGEADAVQIGNLETGIRLVKMDRLDTVIDFGSILEYEIKKRNLDETLTIAPVDADVFDFHCSYSLKAPFDARVLDAHIEQMKQEGFFDQVQNKYR